MPYRACKTGSAVVPITNAQRTLQSPTQQHRSKERARSAVPYAYAPNACPSTPLHPIASVLPASRTGDFDDGFFARQIGHVLQGRKKGEGERWAADRGAADAVEARATYDEGVVERGVDVGHAEHELAGFRGLASLLGGVFLRCTLYEATGERGGSGIPGFKARASYHLQDR